MGQWLSVIGGSISGAALVLVAILTGRWQRATKTFEVTTPSWTAMESRNRFLEERLDKLMQSVDDLRARVEALESERDGLQAEKITLVRERDEIRAQLHQERRENRAYIRALIDAVRAGRPLPNPPSWYEATD